MIKNVKSFSQVYGTEEALISGSYCYCCCFLLVMSHYRSSGKGESTDPDWPEETGLVGWVREEKKD